MRARDRAIKRETKRDRIKEREEEKSETHTIDSETERKREREKEKESAYHTGLWQQTVDRIKVSQNLIGYHTHVY